MRGLDNLHKRMDFLGKGSDGRIVEGKLRSMHAALENSYQAEWVILNGDEELKDTNGKKLPVPKYRCLINPDKLKDDYDKKIISIDFDAGMKEGDVFFWERTNTHWMVTLQHHEEEAYFRASIQRCDYQIEVAGKRYWVYLRGPVETTIQWRQKHKLEFNDLNYSLLMYIHKNEETLKFFSRHQIVSFEGHRWKVAATDKYSSSGYIQVYLDEYFDNEFEETPEIEKEIIIDTGEPYIEGPQDVYAFDSSIVYTIKNIIDGEFVVNSDKVKIIKTDSNSCKLDIIASKSSYFDLVYKVNDEVKAALRVKINSL